jgi:ribosome-associated toxin RatA of RatAB toxin-antitoxin module
MSVRPPHTVRKSVLVPYPAELMYRLVERVEDYPQFLPWCGGSSVLRHEDGTSTATVDIDFRGIRQGFTTHNRNRAHESIEMSLRSGPFSHLHGQWRFTVLRDDACKVEFELEYRFAGGLLGRVLEPVFDSIARSFVDAFVQRAERLHGMD